jgi:outer membrane protein OmpA-like peptidoglycan-associated protein
MRKWLIFTVLVIVIAFSGCVTVPTGPNVQVLPGTGKSFEQFSVDDAICRQFAYEQAGGVTAQQAGQNAAVSSAIIGTAIGAAAGAAIGSASGHVGSGAAIGAGTGLVVGSAAGSGYAASSYYEAQWRYDNAYVQCMYAKGHRVPVPGRFASAETSGPPRRMQQLPPPADYPPPPPPPMSPQPSANIIDRLTLRVNFDVDQAIIRPADKAVLNKMVAFVKKYPDARIEIDGYTDNSGTEAHNRRLSERRAEAVKKYLIMEAGADRSRISAIGRGESNPVADNKTAEGRFENRRVEILILGE